MGIAEGISKFYYSLEAKYYGVLDKINEKIPIYALIDPIDRFAPSFALLILILLALLLFAGVTLLNTIPIQVTENDLTVIVLDEKGSVLEEADVKVVFQSKDFPKKTNKKGEAIFSVPSNAQLSIEISKDKFEAIKKEIKFQGKNQIEQVNLIAVKEEEQQKIFFVKDERGKALKDARVTFTCSDKSARQPDAQTTDFSGKLKIAVPSNCGELTFSARLEKFKNLDGVKADKTTIVLQPDEARVGKITVGITSNGKNLDGVEVHVYRFNEEELGPEKTVHSANGLAVFDNLFAGEYIVRVNAESGFGPFKSEKISLTSGQEKNTQVKLDKKPIGKILVKVLQEKNKLPLEKAKVKLRKGSEELGATDSNSDGIAVFDITEDSEYEVVVDHSDYLVRAVSGVKKDLLREISLEKFTGENGGTLKVKVVDSKGNSVHGAIVALYDMDAKQVSIYEEQSTDLNGVASFTRVQSGNYKALAFKESAKGSSDAQRFDRRLSAQITLRATLIIEDSQVEVIVKDEEGVAVSQARVTLFDEFNDKVVGSDFTSAEGKIVFENIPADKAVYVKVTKEKTSFYSASKKVLPKETVSFNAFIEKRPPLGEVKVKFLGLYKAGEKVESLKEGVVTNVATGERYAARFRVIIPEENDYSEVGLHVRTGTKEILEKDSLFIKAINGPLAEVKKGLSFNPSSGYQEDSKNVAFNDAKWVEFVWNKPTPGIYEFETLIEVKQNAKLDEKLSIFYRTWAIEKGDRKRDPEMPPSKNHPFYDDTEEVLYQVGITTLCDDAFCFDAQILNVGEKIVKSLAEELTYSADVFSNYNLKFNLLNNTEFGENPHTNAFLRIRNPEENLVFERFELNLGDKGKKSGTLNASAFEDQQVEVFEAKERLIADIDFKTQKSGNGAIVIELVSDNQVVFSKQIIVNVSSTKDLDVKFDPRELASGVQNKLSIEVRDKLTGVEVEKALVSVLDRHKIELTKGRTSRQGKVELNLPPQNPGDKLILKTQKELFNSVEQEILVKKEIVSFNPATVGVSVNIKTVQQKDEIINARNLTNFPVKINSIQVTGNFKGVLNEEEMNKFLKQFEGTVLEPSESKELILRTVISEEGKLLNERTDFKSTLRIGVENFGQIWSFELPVTIAVGIGAEVEKPDCLKLSKTEWKISSEGQPVSTEFEIKNDCVVSGKPIPLRNLQVKFNPQGNILGEYLLEIKEDTITKAKVNVRSAFFKNIVAILDPNKRYSAVLSFTPNGGVNGTAKGTLLLSAENKLDSGDQVIESNLETEVPIVNLRECISFSNDLVIIDISKPEGERKGSFKIDTDGCGGKTEFKFDSKLEILTGKNVSLKEKDSKEIEVFAGTNFAGQYPLRIEVKPSHTTTFRNAKMIRVRLIDPNSCVTLDKFEFEVFKEPGNDFSGYDTAELTNNCLEKRVQVKLNMKSWRDAIETGAIWGIAAFAVGTVSRAAAGDEEEKTDGEKPKDKQPAADPTKTQVTDQNQTDQNQQKKGGGIFAWITNVLGLGGRDKNAGPEPATPGKPAGDSDNQTSASIPQTVLNNLPSGATNINIINETINEYNVEYTLNGVKKTQVIDLQAIRTGVTSGDEHQAVAGTALVSGITALAGAEDTGAQLGGAAGDALIGGVSKGIGNMFSGMLGGTAPWVSGLATFALMTGLTYLNQGTTTVETTVNDIGLTPDKFKMLKETGKDGDFDERVSVKPEKESFRPNPKDNRLKVKELGLTFKNEQPGKWTGDIFSVLDLKGDQWQYNTDKEYKASSGFWDRAKKRISENKIDKQLFPFNQKFHLQLTSVNPRDVNFELPPTGPACELLGGGTGDTGPNAVGLPRIGLAHAKEIGWNWDDFPAPTSTNPKGLPINGKICDVSDSNDFIYCDATQFSIAVLRKVETLRKFLEQSNNSFICPAAEKAASTKTNTVKEDNVGISLLEPVKQGNDVNIEVEVFNNNQQQMEVELIVKVSGPNYSKEEKKQLGKITKEKIGFAFTGLGAGDYTVEARINPNTQSCTVCFDKEPNDNIVLSSFTIGASGGLTKCKPGDYEVYNTKNLIEFVEATEEAKRNVTYTGISNNVKEQKKEYLASLINFQSYLMFDRFSKDFQEDFDEYYKARAFAQAPSDYRDSKTGLGVLFRDPSKFKFESRLGQTPPTGLEVSPGLYQVNLEIEFENDSWQLFKNDRPSAVVHVKMQKIKAPSPDSPFYYMPFDGLLGEGNERINYGVNFEGDPDVKLNNDDKMIVKTLDRPGSNAVKDVKVNFSDAFTTLNVFNRGSILSVAQGEKIDLTFSPSYATPVIMKVENNQQDAWAFYSVAINNSTVQSNTGPQNLLWNGIGLQCLDFEGRAINDIYREFADEHAVAGPPTIQCAKVGDNKDVIYGLEWCGPDLPKSGNMFLKTVIFTPQGQTSILQRESGNDKVEFYSPVEASYGEKISLGGTPTSNIPTGAKKIEKNNNLDRLQSIQDIFKLVREGHVCISGTGAKSEFVWNTKPLYDFLVEQEKQAINQCIR